MRGIAILLVVIYHLFYRYNQLYLEALPSLIKYYKEIGVSLFLIISKRLFA
ncbi:MULTISPECIES: heparan-alpha-glucosaminide N-acetyltransferase domain-containing protein [unclassified Streptococcus]|uniref:heparan-alpha-glucosaminide N-acetyltransferase domain-containing protein n=1 Tax=unclassified Streptococcus TaxID=2608887 RepID=UPI0011E69130